MHSQNEPLVRAQRAVSPTKDEVVIEVAGCGVCHTDIGFLYDGVRPGRDLPLTLGHEIAGTVVAAGHDFENLIGKRVVVPAVTPCGECELCKSNRASICRKQVFVGSDVHGGFASHVGALGRGLCVINEEQLAASNLELAELSVIADAVSTPYQAIHRSGLEERDVAIFIGIGGVGGFGVQIASALGAHVIAIDVDDERLAAIESFGPGLLLNSKNKDARSVKSEIRAHVKAAGLSAVSWKIFETSGHAAGQELAFALLTHDAILSVVGYTLDKVTIRLSNLMALDATARGNWGCLPEHYPNALSLVLDGQVKLKPFIESRPMSAINQTIDELRRGALKRRPVLLPDFD